VRLLFAQWARQFNPLAVISARTNYLLAIGDLLPYRRGEVDIPVYLADSILTPNERLNPLGEMTKAGNR
jgi:hypothetical protein